MKTICAKEKCTGCYNCITTCPFKAIRMVKDALGFVYPEIDETKCKNCGMCEKKCPQNNKLLLNTPITAYAMYNSDDVKRSESTSGGIATLLYEYIIKQKGVVYGVSSEIKNREICFIRVDNLCEIQKLKGSKYVQAYVKDIYIQVKQDLIDKKIVLFIGTPCQVSGLKYFLNKDYDNLYTADIICHGVPSQQLLYEELENLHIEKTSKILFRDNDGFNFSCYLNNKKILSIPCRKNNYYRNFLNGTIYRMSCYSCKYANRKRISDITIGDFWGLNNDCKIKDDENKGISLVLPITQKGVKLLDNITDYVRLEERSVDEAVSGNDQLRGPVQKIKKRMAFERDYNKKGYLYAMNKQWSLKDRIKSNDIIYQIYQSIKKFIKKK